MELVMSRKEQALDKSEYKYNEMMKMRYEYRYPLSSLSFVVLPETISSKLT
jgi:hypothetical protein